MFRTTLTQRGSFGCFKPEGLADPWYVGPSGHLHPLLSGHRGLEGPGSGSGGPWGLDAVHVGESRFPTITLTEPNKELSLDVDYSEIGFRFKNHGNGVHLSSISKKRSGRSNRANIRKISLQKGFTVLSPYIWSESRQQMIALREWYNHLTNHATHFYKAVIVAQLCETRLSWIKHPSRKFTSGLIA